MRVCAGSIYLVEIYFTGVLLIDKRAPCENDRKHKVEKSQPSHHKAYPLLCCTQYVAFFLLLCAVVFSVVCYVCFICLEWSF